MSGKQQKRLGKGLSALLGDYAAEAPAQERGELQQLPLAELRPNPYQPRRELPRDGLAELVASIRENGLLQPLVVRPAESGWEIVAGERRWRALGELGWSHVPAFVRPVDDQTMLILALIENLQREALSPLDEARAYRRLLDEFGLTQSEVAEEVGRDRSTVANTLRLLALPEPVQELLRDGEISAGHARALLGLEDEAEAVRLARRVASQGLSVRDVERRVRSDRDDGAEKHRAMSTSRPEAPDPYARRAEQALGRALGTSVSVKLKAKNRGMIEIPFHDAEDFERIVEVIVGVGGIV